MPLWRKGASLQPRHTRTVMKRSGGLRGPGLWTDSDYGAWWMGIPQPASPSLPRYSLLPLGDEQAHYYGILIKGGHYLFTVHFELWQRNPLLLVSHFWLRNEVTAGWNRWLAARGLCAAHMDTVTATCAGCWAVGEPSLFVLCRDASVCRHVGRSGRSVRAVSLFLRLFKHFSFRRNPFICPGGLKHFPSCRAFIVKQREVLRNI